MSRRPSPLPLIALLGVACVRSQPEPAAPARNVEASGAESIMGNGPELDLEVQEVRIDADVEALADWKSRIRTLFPGVRGMAVAELAKEFGDGGAASDGPLLLDVRAPEEFAVSQIRGAVRAETIEEALAVLEGVPSDRRIVAYCSIGYRSAEMVEQLNERGFENAVNLEGSIFEWGNAGHPVHRGDAAVELIHPFDATWGLLLDAKRRAPVGER